MNPPKPVDPQLVEKLASIMCTEDEIASCCGVCSRTLRRRFRKALDRGRAAGRMSLRRAQFVSAVERGNVIAQIWLGKQWLGQRDRTEIATTPVPTVEASYARMTNEELEAEIDRMESDRHAAAAVGKGRTGTPTDAAVPPVRLLAPAD